MLRELGIRLVTLAIGFAVMIAVVPGIDKKGNGTVVVAALVYMVLNATLGFVLKLLTAPLAIVTLGLSLLAVNRSCWPSRRGSSTASTSTTWVPRSSAPCG